MRILILEDNPLVKKLLQSRLEGQGHDVEAVENGHQGFQLATSVTFDVIISDIMMPHWDGFKFIEATEVVCPHLPIIIVTSAFDNDEVRTRLSKCTNVIASLPKPIDFPILFEHLSTVSRQTHTTVNKKAKIVCTVGPSSDTESTLSKMMLAGMDIARLNFSHGSHEDHYKILQSIREAEKAWGKPIGVLQDLCGPKIRTGLMTDGAVELKPGDPIIIQASPVEGTAERISTIAPDIIADLKVGDPILLDDGLLELRVRSEGSNQVECEVVVGGRLKSSKGINLPSTALSLPSITDKDWHDLDWGLSHTVDYVALSFVRYPQEILSIKEKIASSGNNNLRVVAKIEKPEAVQNIKEIIKAADGIMIARGDMGVELPAAKVPRIQERIIQLCWELNKPVITATQMLDSMTTNARPTRAEVTDVSMAIKEGTDAVMLSQETAAGIDPVNVVRTMASIICEEERHTPMHSRHHPGLAEDAETNPTLSAMASITATSATLLLDPKGELYPLLSKWNRTIPTLLLTQSMQVARHAALYKNIFPLLLEQEQDRDAALSKAIAKAKEAGYVKNGEMIAVMEGGRATATSLEQVGAVQILRL